jgi:peroxiredoxin family protein/rhodanese-related sulfurtransferase/TusA-related sulfurtransferase
VKVFDMTGGGTGASEKTLKRAGRPYRKIYIHPSGHAGYYPGTGPMHLKLLFAPDSGRILGAQIVGFDGVDKRLDVLAAAIQFQRTVYDLEMLELCYAPPYGSARDPVNMAGFVASNLLRGDVRFWYAEDFPTQTEGGLMVDVRGPQEFELGHIPGATNIPLAKLRSRLADLPKGKPVFLYCKVGFRSYLAYRILRQNGFVNVSTLAGGYLTFINYHRDAVPGEKREAPFLPYAEEKMAMVTPPSGRHERLNCVGLQCPGPIKRIKEMLDTLTVGDELEVTASDPGFPADARAWCERGGHALVSIEQKGAASTVVIRKGAPVQAAAATGTKSYDKAMVVFSGDLDKVLAAFVIANGAVSMGSKVTMFFTFWGLNALRKDMPQAGGKSLLDKMFGMMMPKGPGALALSQMHMAGMGTAMMKYVMKQKNVESLPELMESARRAGVKMVACTMSMDVMGLQREELIDGIELGGVAAFLSEADKAGTTLFI